MEKPSERKSCPLCGSELFDIGEDGERICRGCKSDEIEEGVFVATVGGGESGKVCPKCGASNYAYFAPLKYGWCPSCQYRTGERE